MAALPSVGDRVLLRMPGWPAPELVTVTRVARFAGKYSDGSLRVWVRRPDRDRGCGADSWSAAGETRRLTVPSFHAARLRAQVDP